MAESKIFDVNKLSRMSLRKYESFHKLDVDYNDAENFEKNLKAKVQEHFQNEYKVDSKRVIDALLKLKKDDKVDLELIKTKPVRNKPKIMTGGF